MKGDFTRSTFKREKHYSSVRMQQGRVQLDADWNEQMGIQAHLTHTEAKDIIGPCGVPRKGGGFEIEGLSLIGIYFITQNKGWVVGRNAIILTTNDGGKTWTKQTAPEGIIVNLHAVQFVDKNHGWIVGEEATILATKDGGETWERQTTPEGINARLMSVHFIDNSHGWAVGDSSTILIYKEREKEWVTAKRIPSTKIDLSAVYFVDKDNGWAVGYESGAMILYTANGGEDWKTQNLQADFKYSLDGVQFVDKSIGFAFGRNTLFATTDGVNWVKAGQLPLSDSDSYILAVHFADKDNGWAVDSKARILRTVHGGTSWEIYAPPDEVHHELVATHLVDIKQGWAVERIPTNILSTENGKDWTLKSELTFFISPGRIYVDGIMCENERGAAFTAQPDFPGASLPKRKEDENYLFYLDVWHHHITALEDPSIREVALGGPDTTTRIKTVWQVKCLPITDKELTCNKIIGLKKWQDIIAPSTGKLLARTKPDSNETDLCKMPSRGGYRRLENQLYRVEIHQLEKIGRNITKEVTFKWSRDNGSIATLGTIDGNNISVSDPGKDSQLRFAPGQWIEISDESNVLRGKPGVLVELASMVGNMLTVKSWPIRFVSIPEKKYTVRRWDSDGDSRVEIPTTNDGWIPLKEDGIEIKFEYDDLSGYKTGDYWLIPARTATGDIEWPRDESNNPLPQLPLGIKHHYCPLAIGEFDGERWNIIDCRRLFLPIAELASDGIHVMAVEKQADGSLWMPLGNDTDLTTKELSLGKLRIVCDKEIYEKSIGRPTCFVTLDIPYLGGFLPIILAADVMVDKDIIIWKPILAENQKKNLNDYKEPVLAHLTLKGNFIWAANNPSLYLDGETFGVPNGQTTGILLPSGNGRRGSDFEMWFWIVNEEKTHPTIESFKISGEVASVILDRPASRRIEIDLASSSPKVEVPKKIFIPAGEKSATFNFKVQPVEGVPHYATITASYGGITKTSPKLTLNPPG